MFIVVDVRSRLIAQQRLGHVDLTRTAGKVPEMLFVGGGLDGQRFEALTETQACRGVRLTVRRSV